LFRRLVQLSRARGLGEQLAGDDLLERGVADVGIVRLRRLPALQFEVKLGRGDLLAPDDR
jgi:hypothetical protein